MESYPKRTRHQHGDHYGRAGRALFPYSPRLRVHSGRHLGGYRVCWTPSRSVSGCSPTVNGSHILVIRPSVWPAPLVSPPSPSASEEIDPRWVGLLGCWTWRKVPTVRWDEREPPKPQITGDHWGSDEPRLLCIVFEISC